MDVLARIQPYFGSTLEDVIQTERTRLPAGATVIVITSTVTDQLLDILIRIKQSGHAVTILFVGDTLSPMQLAGITIHHLGGSKTWRNLEATYSTSEEDKEEDVDGKVSELREKSVGFRL